MVSTNRARKALRLDFFPEPQSTLTVRVVLVLAKHRAGAIHIPSTSGTNPDRTRQRMVAAFMPAVGADVFLFHLVAEPSAGNGRRFVDGVTPGLVELAAALGPRDDGIRCTAWEQWGDRRKKFQYQRGKRSNHAHAPYLARDGDSRWWATLKLHGDDPQVPCTVVRLD